MLRLEVDVSDTGDVSNGTVSSVGDCVASKGDSSTEGESSISLDSVDADDSSAEV